MSADKVVQNIIASRAAGRAALQAKKAAPTKKRKLTEGSSSTALDSNAPSALPPSTDKQVSTEEGTGARNEEVPSLELALQVTEMAKEAPQRLKEVISAVEVTSSPEHASDSEDLSLPENPRLRSSVPIPRSTDHYRVIAAGHGRSIKETGILQEYVDNMFTEKDLAWASSSLDLPCRIMKRGLESALLAKEVADRLRRYHERQEQNDNAYRLAEKQLETYKKDKAELLKEKENWHKDYQNWRTELEEMNRQYLQTSEELRAARQKENDLASQLNECRAELEETKKGFNEQIAKAVEEAKKIAVEEYKGTVEFEAELQKRAEPVFDSAIKDYRETLLGLYPDLDISSIDEKYCIDEPTPEDPEGGEVSEENQTEEFQPGNLAIAANEGSTQPASVNEQRLSEVPTLPDEVLAIAKVAIEQTEETPTDETE